MDMDGTQAAALKLTEPAESEERVVASAADVTIVSRARRITTIR